MPVYIATARIRDDTGRTVAVRRAPFIVRHHHEHHRDLVRELSRIVAELEAVIEEEETG